MKILINTTYHPFDVSQEFKEAYPNIFQPNYFYEKEEEFRTDPEVIAAVEEFGTNKASAHLVRIVIAEIPDDATEYHIIQDDGAEELLYILDGKLRLWVVENERLERVLNKLYKVIYY